MMSVALTRVQKPWTWKPLTIDLVITSISNETKNQAIPKVRIASGSVTSLRSGLRTVFSTPNTAAASISDPAFETSTPCRTPATIASTSAFVAHEIASRTSTGGERFVCSALAIGGSLV
jgi:hypothetical protein